MCRGPTSDSSHRSYVCCNRVTAFIATRKHTSASWQSCAAWMTLSIISLSDVCTRAHVSRIKNSLQIDYLVRIQLMVEGSQKIIYALPANRSTVFCFFFLNFVLYPWAAACRLNDTVSLILNFEPSPRIVCFKSVHACLPWLIDSCVAGRNRNGRNSDEYQLLIPKPFDVCGNGSTPRLLAGTMTPCVALVIQVCRYPRGHGVWFDGRIAAEIQ